MIQTLISGALLLSPHIDIHGHRGSRGNLPENTLPAFEFAIEHGADYLEMDLAVTRDGVLVVSHDPHIEDKLIHDLTLDQIKKIDCGAHQNPNFPHQKILPGTRMPTLDEVFELVRHSKHVNAKTIRFNIETKIFPDHPEYTLGPDEFSDKVVTAFRESGFLDRIILQSFDPRTLIASKKLDPKLVTSLLIEDPNIDMIAKAKEIGATIISPNFTLVNAELVNKAHEANLKVVPWTVNTESDWERLAKMKVDGIITDYCDRLSASKATFNASRMAS